MFRLDKAPIAINELKTLVEYREGSLYWLKKGKSRNRFKSLGSKDKDGYLYFNLYGRNYRVHRVVWALFNDAWPTHNIDHIDGCVTNNKIENLRDATQAINTWNRHISVGEVPYQGVSRSRGRFQTSICVAGKYKFLGRYDTAEEAYEVYRQAKIEHHGIYLDALIP